MQLTKVILTADIIIENEDGIVLVKRKNEPFKDKWALPGGLMDGDETIEEAAIRETKEEAGLDVKLERIIGVYSKPFRDPRGRYVSVAFAATITSGKLKAADDAAEIKATKDHASMQLAFDHNQIIIDYLSSKNIEKKN